MHSTHLKISFVLFALASIVQAAIYKGKILHKISDTTAIKRMTFLPPDPFKNSFDPIAEIEGVRSYYCTQIT